MEAPPLRHFIRSILGTTHRSNHSSEETALLSIPPIVDFLNERGLRYEISEFPIEAPWSDRYFAYGTEISTPDGNSFVGYSSGPSPHARSISLIEAFERYCFRKIVSDPDSAGFAPGDLPSATRYDHRWLKNTLGLQIPESGRYFLGAQPSTGKIVAVDPLFVYGDDVHYPSTTSGLACHPSYQQAAYSACLEVYERDTLLRKWFLNETPRPLPPSHSAAETLAIEMTSKEGFQVRSVGYTTSIGLPVCLTVLYSPTARLFFMGSGAALTWQGARDKATREALMIWIFDYLGTKDLGDLTRIPDENQIKRLAPHFNLLCEFFVRTAHRSDPIDHPDPSPDESLERLFRAFDFSLLPIVIPGLKEGAPLLVKAFSPHAAPLFKNEIPLVLPPDFAILVKGRGAFHPY